MVTISKNWFSSTVYLSLGGDVFQLSIIHLVAFQKESHLKLWYAHILL